MTNEGNKAVNAFDPLVDIQSASSALVASTVKKLSDIVTVDPNARAATISVTGSVYYSPVRGDDADATKALLPAVYVANGGKSILDQITFFSTGTPTVSIIIHD